MKIAILYQNTFAYEFLKQFRTYDIFLNILEHYFLDIFIS